MSCLTTAALVGYAWGIYWQYKTVGHLFFRMRSEPNVKCSNLFEILKTNNNWYLNRIVHLKNHFTPNSFDTTLNKSEICINRYIFHNVFVCLVVYYRTSWQIIRYVLNCVSSLGCFQLSAAIQLMSGENYSLHFHLLHPIVPQQSSFKVLTTKVPLPSHSAICVRVCRNF